VRHLQDPKRTLVCSYNILTKIDVSAAILIFRLCTGPHYTVYTYVVVSILGAKPSKYLLLFQTGTLGGVDADGRNILKWVLMEGG
jgi:hypothetical protein